MKKHLCILLYLIGMASSLTAQKTAVYIHPFFGALTADHQELAILPFDVTLELRPREGEKVSAEKIQQLAEKEGLEIQNTLYGFFLKKSVQKDLTVTVQDIVTTNALLAKQGITRENIHAYTPQEVAKLLKVDGVIMGNLLSSKPMSEDAAVFIGVVTGFYGSINSGKCTVKVYDAKTDALLWRYEKKLSRGLGSGTQTIITAIMRRVIWDFPFREA
ncbi:MAG: hypothetical protein AAFW00_09670 [Bacteroidota bacterium]